MTSSFCAAPPTQQRSGPRLEEFGPVLCLECNFCSLQCWLSSLQLKMENERDEEGVAKEAGDGDGEEEEEEDGLYKGLKCLGQTVGMCCAPLLALCCVAQVCICGPIVACGSKILDLCCCRTSEKEEEGIFEYKGEIGD